MEDVDTAERDWLRPGLVLCALCAIVATAVLLPAFATEGLAGSPIDRVLPGDTPEQQAAGGAGSGAGGLGALNPGDTTGVGGEVGFDSDTYGTLDTELHFTVESSTETYWRTATFDHYTGSGWERTSEPEPLEEPIEHTGEGGEQIDYEIELAQSATAVPTVWRPQTVDAGEELQVTDDGAVSADRPIEAGETIEGVSQKPERDIATLQAAGENYPTEIEQRYTQLPDETPDRLESFTSDLTADAENPYETATTIESWLEESKEYDLDASQQSDSIADTFVFEMDAGYCEYFATAMVSMLRTQDIPARYVVGYSTGQPAGDNTYEVRAMNAHAWVEVYFEDVGWVRFDPTPGNERLSAQQEALSDIGEEYDQAEIGSPGDVFEPGEQETSGLQTELNQSAVPGEAVEVTVEYDDMPLRDVGVSFNGESVGTTDGDGTVVGTVPDAEELRITVDNFDTSDPVEPAVEDSAGSIAAAGSGAVTALSQDETAADPPEETHPIEREATIAVSGDPAPGNTVTLTVSAGDRQLDGATITADGSEVGQTDDDGQIELELPEESGEVRVGVERGPVSGDATIEIPELELAVDTGTLPSVSGSTVTVEATLDDEPAAGEPIELNGETVATTASDGTATVRLPAASEAAISVTASGQSQQVVLSGLLWRLGVLLSVFFALVSAPLYALSRRGYDLRWFHSRLTGLPNVIVDTARSTLIGIARGRIGPQTVAHCCANWLSGQRKRLLRRFDSAGDSESSRSGHSDQLSVQDAWDQFVDQLSVQTVETQTPGELATHAVETDELPEDAVLMVRDTFREVEYGSRQSTDHHQRIAEAIREIEQR